MIIGSKYNWLIIAQLFLILAYCTPAFSQFLHGIVYFVPILIFLFIAFTLSKSFTSVFSTVINSFRKNHVLFIMMLWYISGLTFSFLRHAENTIFLLNALLLPIFFLYGLLINTRTQYHHIAVPFLVICLFLNTFFTGSEIGTDLSAKAIMVQTDSLANPIGTAGYWGSIGIFFPLFIVSLRKIRKKIVLVTYIAVLIYLIYKLIFSGYATALGLLALNTITIALLFLYYRSSTFVRFLGSVILLTVTLGVVYYLVEWLLTSNLSGLIDVQWRLQNVIDDPTSGGYDKNYISRYDLFFVSLETFMRYPIFGSGADIMSMYVTKPELSCGGHSSFIDVPAILGLLGGGGAWVYFFFKSLSNSYSSLKKTRSFEDLCHTSVVFTLIIGGILNPFWMGSILIIFLLITRIYKISPTVSRR